MAKIKKTGRHTSGIKAHRQSLKHRAKNYQTRNGIKEIRKDLTQAVASKDKTKAQGLLKEVYSKLDKAVKSGVLHWRNGARKKASFARQVTGIAS